MEDWSEIRKRLNWVYKLERDELLKCASDLRVKELGHDASIKEIRFNILVLIMRLYKLELYDNRDLVKTKSITDGNRSKTCTALARGRITKRRPRFHGYDGQVISNMDKIAKIKCLPSERKWHFILRVCPLCKPKTEYYNPMIKVLQKAKWNSLSTHDYRIWLDPHEPMEIIKKDLQNQKWEKILKDRFQLFSESCVEYVTDVMCLALKLNYNLGQIVETINRNALLPFKRYLKGKEFVSLEHLLAQTVIFDSCRSGLN